MGFFIACFCNRSCCHVLRLSEALRPSQRLSGYIYIATLFQRLSEALRGSHVVIYGILSGSQALRLSGSQHSSVSTWYHDFMFWGSQRRFKRFRLYHSTCIASYSLRGSQRLSGTLRGILCCSALPRNTFQKDFIFSTLGKAHSVLVSYAMKAQIDNILTATVVLFRIAQQCIIPSCYG